MRRGVEDAFDAELDFASWQALALTRTLILTLRLAMILERSLLCLRREGT